MNKDSHLISEAYKVVREQQFNPQQVQSDFNKMIQTASSMPNKKDLTPQQVEQIGSAFAALLGNMMPGTKDPRIVQALDAFLTTTGMNQTNKQQLIKIATSVLMGDTAGISK